MTTSNNTSREDRALHNLERRYHALFEAATSVHEFKSFEETAKNLFYSCSDLIGSTAGYVALLSDDGLENEVLFLEDGGRECTVPHDYPMPIRGLRALAYKFKKAVYDNDFMNSKWVKFMPQGHCTLDNVLFAPLVIGEKTAGIMGLANKPEGFTEEDVEIATVYGKLSAIVLKNSRLIEEVVSQASELKESKRTLETILRNLRTAVFVVDPEHKKILEVNKQGEKLLRLTSEEIKLQMCCDLLCDYDCRKSEGCISYAQNSVPQELTLQLKNNEIVEVEKHIIPISRAGHKVFIAVLFDVSERKHAERSLANRSKFESVGQLAAGLAHEINTPVQYISSNLEYIQTMISELSSSKGSPAAGSLASDREDTIKEMHEALADIKIGLDQVTAIVSSMRYFSHPDDGVKTSCNVNKVLKNIVTITRNEWKQVAEIEMDFADYTYFVDMVPSELTQVLLNLVINAVHAIKKQQASSGDSSLGRIFLSIRFDDGSVVFSVQDSGAGIAPEIRDRIYDPFFTTKDIGEGTGQGLALSRAIIERSDGIIEFDSTPGQGTTFRIHLPGEKHPTSDA